MSTFTWGTVTALSPLRIKLDGDTAALPFTPDSLVDPLTLAVDNRVRCELASNRLVVLGRAGGVVEVPPGVVSATAAAAAPSGWLICDGAAVSRTTYAALFTAIGTQFGTGDGSTTFNVPNLKGRVVVGMDSGQTEFDVLGETGGAKTHTLTVAEMPSHTHTQNPHSHEIDTAGTALKYILRASPGTGSGMGGMASAGAALNATAATATNQNTGGGGAHNNLQPYIVLNYAIKV